MLAHLSSFTWDLTDGQRFVLLLAIIGCATAVGISAMCVLAGTVRGVRQTKLNAGLKREMIERGMSAEEIARVIEAAPPDSAVTNKKR